MDGLTCQETDSILERLEVHLESEEAREHGEDCADRHESNPRPRLD